jgi:PKD repeat protein
MKKLLYTGALFLAFVSVKAQNFSPCGTDEQLEMVTNEDPSINLKMDAFNNSFKNFMQTVDLNEFKAVNKNKNEGPIYYLPVVFHILHNNGSENISDQRIRDEITILNRNFRANSTFRNRIREIFKDVEADARIEFRLAKFDPNGIPTNGIQRIYVGPLASRANDNVKLGGWDPWRYLNIWVAGGIVTNSPFPVGGYAYFPNGAPSARVDGCIVLASTVGNITSNNPFDYNTVGHEVGHYLGLAHPFQGSQTDTCSLDGDFLFDTPPTFFTPGVGRFSGISTRNFCLNPDSNTCTTDNPDLPDQYENFMDYFNGQCANNMFTLQQAARMRFALENYRRGLWSEENLIATGIKYDTFDSRPLPIPAFNLANNQSLLETRVCVGVPVQFREASWNAAITSWEWSFGEGATPQTHIGQTPPAVTYTTPGKKTIRLTVTGVNGSNTLDAVDYLHIEGPAEAIKTASAMADWDYQNNFLEQGWYFENEMRNINPWSRITTTAFDGIASIRLNSRQLSNNFRYSIVSPSFDFTGATNPYIEFQYAFAPNLTTLPSSTGSVTGDSQDGLTVFVSTDCGRNWVQRGFLGGQPTSNNPNRTNPLSTLPVNETIQASGVQNTVNFIPSGRSQWRRFAVSGLNNIPAQSNVRFKITFNAQGGNNFYIDNLMTGMVTSVSEVSKSQLGFEAFPNPFSSETNLRYNLPLNTHVTISVYDITGKQIATVVNEQQTTGTHNVSINKNTLGLTKGIYFVKITLGHEQTYAHKLMVD